MNNYHEVLTEILKKGKKQENRKGVVKYLIYKQLKLKPTGLLEVFEGHGIARMKLKNELELFQQGERLTEKYRDAGITWWDYCGPHFGKFLPYLF